MITHVCGTRPNDVKVSALYPELKKKGVKQKVLHTGQHFSENMHAVSIKIDEYGNCKNNLGGMIEWLLPRLEGNAVVYGDTNSSLAGAIASKQRRLPLYHVEAGMRCGDTQMIEEWNRIQIDSISQKNFVTSDQYLPNVPSGTGIVVGDVMYDLFMQRTQWPQEEGFPLLTLHRAEHTEDADKLRSLFTFLRKKFPDWQISFVVHPRTLRFCIDQHISLDAFNILDPVPYYEFQHLLLRAGVVITDSGGVSKEAAWATKPCYILREKSEWGFPTVGSWGERWRKVDAVELKIESGKKDAAKKIAEFLSNDLHDSDDKS